MFALPFALIYFVAAIVASLSEAKLVSNSHWVANSRDVPLGNLAQPTVTVAKASANVPFVGQGDDSLKVKGDLKKAIQDKIGANEQGLDALVEDIYQAVTMQTSKWTFWVDTNIGAGKMKVLVIQKDNDTVALTIGAADVSIPTPQHCAEECTKKKVAGVTIKRKCKTKCENRGLNQNELNQISAHLTNALKNHGDLRPLLSA